MCFFLQFFIEHDTPEQLNIPLKLHQRQALAWMLGREKTEPRGGKIIITTFSFFLFLNYLIIYLLFNLFNYLFILFKYRYFSG